MDSPHVVEHHVHGPAKARRRRKIKETNDVIKENDVCGGQNTRREKPGEKEKESQIKGP
jgi:hypothetical protein